MSSSSPPEPPKSGHLAQLAIADVEEAEAALQQHLHKAEGALGEAAAAQKKSAWLGTLGFAAPGFVWLGFYLIAPLVFIVLVSFWTRTDSGFVQTWTLHNYGTVFHDNTFWANLATAWDWPWKNGTSSLETSLIAVFVTLVLGFPVAYYLTFKVENMRYQIALFIVAMAPFWTSFLIRSVAWTYPLMGRQGGLNSVLVKIGILSQPWDGFAFSTLSVRLAMIQLYILFMITPLFFMLANVDRSSIESARDLGASFWKMFREIILRQSMPGIVIGSIFIFVLTMGEYGTVRVIGGGNVQSAGTLVQNSINAIQYPQGAAQAVFLLIALIIGVFIILRFANLREEL
jgi:putative spermidine/putrescine transport system permease protein